jgi:hypothetical protein
MRVLDGSSWGLPATVMGEATSRKPGASKPGRGRFSLAVAGPGGIGRSAKEEGKKKMRDRKESLSTED